MGLFTLSIILTNWQLNSSRKFFHPPPEIQKSSGEFDALPISEKQLTDLIRQAAGLK
jgi:hypothetical protein